MGIQSVKHTQLEYECKNRSNLHEDTGPQRKSVVMALERGTALTSVQREWNARERVYIVQDCSSHPSYPIADGTGGPYAGGILVSQRLPTIAAHINDRLCTHQCERVTVAGMYDAVNRANGVGGGLHKHRWRIRSVPLKVAATEIESMRHMPSDAVAHTMGCTVLGQRDCWSMRPLVSCGVK